jgi:hypothetical protein
MKLTKGVRKPMALLISLLILLCSSACHVPPQIVRHEFEPGIKMGEEFAQNDAEYIQCWRISSHIDADQEARTYKSYLETLGKSQSFILGFYDGYERAYNQYIDMYCGP